MLSAIGVYGDLYQFTEPKFPIILIPSHFPLVSQ